jgi:hypothetical protein
LLFISSSFWIYHELSFFSFKFYPWHLSLCSFGKPVLSAVAFLKSLCLKNRCGKMRPV